MKPIAVLVRRARVALWPELPMDGWRGNPAAIHNRLIAMLGWTEPY